MTAEITWHRLLDERPPKSGEYQVRNAQGFITSAYYQKPHGFAVYCSGWSGSIVDWAEKLHVH